MQVIQDDYQRTDHGQLTQEVGVLFEDAILCERRPADGRLGGGLLCQAIQLLEPADPAGDGLAHDAGQPCAGDDKVDQIGAHVDQDLPGLCQQAPQSRLVLMRYSVFVRSVFKVAGQERQDLAEGEIGIGLPLDVAAVPPGRHQRFVLWLGLRQKGPQQAGLARAGLTGDEGHTAVPSKRFDKRSPEAIQLRLASDEDF